MAQRPTPFMTAPRMDKEYTRQRIILDAIITCATPYDTDWLDAPRAVECIETIRHHTRLSKINILERLSTHYSTRNNAEFRISFDFDDRESGKLIYRFYQYCHECKMWARLMTIPNVEGGDDGFEEDKCDRCVAWMIMQQVGKATIKDEV